MAVAFRLLGNVEADVDGRRVHLGHARQCCVLVALLVDAGRVVPVEVLVDRVWPGRLPQRVRSVLSGYVSRLRRVLAGAPEVCLERASGGYQLVVDPASVDVHRFRQLVERAATEDEDTAEALVSEALDLWRGDPFGTLDTPWLNEVRCALNAERLAAELVRNDLALRHGRHGELLTGLVTRAAEHPLDERLAGQLMLALCRSGRQAEALRHYERLRQRLADELGTDPSPPLSALHQQILAADPAVVDGPAASFVPRQLPAPPYRFVGRARELAALLGVAPSTTVISGTAGVGKTALALHWSHRIADRFPDGQLYVNLRGFDPAGAVLRPEEALCRFLDALGVAPHRVPADLDAQACLYRSRLAGRQMLVMLDNARDAEQVRPLLPSTRGCLVVVTSRDQLTGLVAAEGAHPVTLDLLTTAEARELLADRIGAHRVAAEPDAVDEVIDRCARLPLALVAAAARAATRPAFPLSVLATELRERPGQLDALAGPDPLTDVRAVFSSSYRALTPDAATLFRLLGPHPGPDISAPAVASLAGVPPARTHALLAELTRAHLLTEHVPGRYAFHDLLRAYATEQLHGHDTQCWAATRRLLDHYLHTAHAATCLIDPYQGDRVDLSPPEPGVVPEGIASQREARAWFTAEFPALLTAVTHAANRGFEHHTWSLAWAMGEYGFRTGHWLALVDAFRTSLYAAERAHDRRGQCVAHRGLGIAYHLRGHQEQAAVHFGLVIELSRQLGDREAEAGAHSNMCAVAGKLAHPEESLDHARQALDLRRAIGDRVGEARALNLVGQAHLELGSHGRGVACLEQALVLLQETDDWLGLAATWASVGNAHHLLGHYPQAIGCYHHSLRFVRTMADHYYEATTLVDLGDTHHAMGHLDLARDAWQQAVTRFEDLDHSDADDVRAKLHAIRPATNTAVNW